MAGRVRRCLWTVSRALAVAAAGLVVVATPAAADAPAPGDYSSEVTSVEPPVRTIDIEVVGGDSFLRLEADPGTEVVVLGYDDEPFLRVRGDGTVEQNANSPATYLNDDRYAQVSIPPRLSDVDASELEPEWEAVGSGGVHAWHDHRIHWMAPDAPPAVDRGSSFDWNGTVPLIVDGEPVDVSGVIHYRTAFSPLPWIGAGLLGAALCTLAFRSRARLGASLATVIAAGAALVAWATWSAAPAGVGASSLPLVTAAAATALGIAALIVPSRHRPIVLLAVAAVLGSWALLRFSVLTNPVLPTDLPFAADRGVTVAALAVAIALGATAIADVAPTGSPHEPAPPSA